MGNLGPNTRLVNGYTPITSNGPKVLRIRKWFPVEKSVFLPQGVLPPKDPGRTFLPNNPGKEGLPTKKN